MDLIQNSSGSPFAKETAIAILYSKYNKECQDDYAGTIYEDVYDLLKECNFWKDSYSKVYSKLDSSSYRTIDEDIVLGLLNYKFGKDIECAPIAQDVINVCSEAGILRSTVKKDKDSNNEGIQFLSSDEYNKVYYCSKEKDVLSVLQKYGLEDEWKELGKNELTKEDDEYGLYASFRYYIIVHTYERDYSHPIYKNGFYIHIESEDNYRLRCIGYFIFRKQPSVELDDFKQVGDVEDGYLKEQECWCYSD